MVKEGSTAGSWKVASHCRPVCHTLPALPTYLPASGFDTQSEDDESEVDNWKRRRKGIVGKREERIHLSLMISGTEYSESDFIFILYLQFIYNVKYKLHSRCGHLVFLWPE